MCGRFTLIVGWRDVSELAQLLEKERGRNVPARYNIAPTQDVLIIDQKDNQRRVQEAQWWLVPHWAKKQAKYPTFNARAETALEKPSFRDAFKSNRCLIPADGYYEWIKTKNKKRLPYFIHLKDKAPFCFAGLWAHNTQLDLISCTILTVPAAPQITHLHPRMPVILKPDAYDGWLDMTQSPQQAHALLDQNLGDQLQSYRVHTQINSSRWLGDETAIEPHEEKITPETDDDKTPLFRLI